MKVADTTFNADVRLCPLGPTQCFPYLGIELIAEHTCLAGLHSAFRLMYSSSATNAATAATKGLFVLPRLQYLPAVERRISVVPSECTASTESSSMLHDAPLPC